VSWLLYVFGAACAVGGSFLAYPLDAWLERRRKRKEVEPWPEAKEEA
jgi:hypothetical protein